jgi:hypothetical protein
LKDEFGTREVKLVGDKDSLFKRGKRINIKLCYGIDENLKTMFDGYIALVKQTKSASKDIVRNRREKVIYQKSTSLPIFLMKYARH